MAVNKVVYGDRTIIDITDTDAEEADVAQGKTFYKKSGEKGTGTAVETTYTASNGVKIDSNNIQLDPCANSDIDEMFTASEDDLTNPTKAINVEQEAYFKQKIQSEIDDEATARANADTAEASARASKDTALESDIGTNTSNIATLQTTKADGTALTAETTARENGDTSTLSNAKTYCDSQIAGQSYIKQTVVSSLPATGQANIQYLVPISGTTGKYTIHAWIDDAWQQLGSTEVDLTNYYNKTEVNTLLAGKSDTSHTHANASGSAAGFMSAESYTKVNALPDTVATETLVFTLSDGTTLDKTFVIDGS